ncbi:MAG: NACHT domain-containing protein [Chloroflexota bacterium]
MNQLRGYMAFGKIQTKAIFILAFLFVMLSVSFAHAQTPTPLFPRDVLIQSVTEQAQRDGKQGIKETTEGLNLLFGEQAKLLGMTFAEVKKIYDDAFQAAIPAKSPWNDLLHPQGGWPYVIVGVVLAILAGMAKEYIGKAFKWLAEAAYQRLARFRPFWAIALYRYRQSLESTYCALKIPFRQNKPLQMQDVYVPLSALGGDRHMVDAYQTIQKHKRIVVLGNPGSGKTMLLSHIAFTYARQGLDTFPGQPIPIYLELTRVGSAENALLDALTKTIENHNFPGAQGFLQASLKNGTLLILLDGLDEVNALSRPPLVKQINDLSQKYFGSHIIITCRKAVYQGEFDTWADQQLEIIEFNDQQIQRFMTPWQKDMPADKSIEHFFRTLQERPQIMALARNPLLLTMVAYLYTDTEFALPHSRSEFYTRSTNLLLDQWKLERNHYKPAYKRLVLQRLALYNQNQAGQTGGRRTIELAQALQEICSILPDLTLKTEDAQPLLDEIVQRSGLLLAFDGGQYYKFTHLTLQEFYAARALESDENKLLENFRTSPDAWREVLRLWCALEHDSTLLLKQLYTIDPLMTLECLSDAQQIDQDFSNQIFQAFQPRLSESQTSESLAAAFALMAANPSDRGLAWLTFLKNGLQNSSTRFAACSVLARTNLPEAARFLAGIADTVPEARPFLTRMGNLAVPFLGEFSKQGYVWPMDMLVEIGTPWAALALQPILWSVEPPIARQSAWRLAALLPLPGVEDALRMVNLSLEQRASVQITWIWEPFGESAGSSLPVIAGRTAYLLHNAFESVVPSNPLSCDARLALPLCAIAAQDGQLAELKDNERREMLKTDSGVFSDIAHRISTNHAWRKLCSGLPASLQAGMLRILIEKDPLPNPDDWRNLYRPSDFSFGKSFQLIGIKILVTLLGLLNLWGIFSVSFQRPQFWSWENVVSLLLLAIIILAMPLGVWRAKPDLPILGVMLCVLAMGIGPAFGCLAFFISSNLALSIAMLFMGTGAAFLIGFSCVGLSSLGAEELEHAITFNSFFSSIFGFIGIIFGIIGLIITSSISIRITSSIISSISIRNNIINIIITIIISSSFVSFIFGLFSIILGIISRRIKTNISSIDHSIMSYSAKIFINMLRNVDQGMRIGGLLLGVLMSISSGTLFLLAIYVPTELIIQALGYAGMVTFWFLYLVGIIILLWSAKRQQRLAQNPMHQFIPYLPGASKQPKPKRSWFVEVLSAWFNILLSRGLDR